MNPFPLEETGLIVVISLAKVVGVFSLFMVILTWMSWLERRVCAILQDRSGPNRVGPAGLLQPVADAIKLIQKEDLIPSQVNKWLYILGPALVALPALIVFAVVPIGMNIPEELIALPCSLLHELTGIVFVTPEAIHAVGDVSLAVSDVPSGLLFLLAVSSLGVYGLALGAWSANNKYATMGGVRASAQMISYELSLGVALVTLILMSSSATLSDMVMAQADTTLGIPHWNLILNPVTSLILIIAWFAETNRLPFDFAEAEPELIAGYHIEHSGMKFAMFMIGEAAAMLTASALIVSLTLGGWHVPGIMLLPPALAVPLSIGVFLGKLMLVLLVFIVVRWSIPRFRYDQLMKLGWTRLLPAALGMLFVTLIAKEALAWVR